MSRSLLRVLEPEVMDTPEEAEIYDAMDHRAVNRAFADDLLGFASIRGRRVLDVGTGTALIPIELLGRDAGVHVVAIDLAQHMLDLGARNVDAAGLGAHIELERVDAKAMPYPAASFGAVVSNSIIHHIPEPARAVAEMVRVVATDGVIFVRDLLRPDNEAAVRALVEGHVGGENDHARALFEASLHAALSVDEMRALVIAHGFAPDTVQPTSDRHWTWAARTDPEGNAA